MILLNLGQMFDLPGPTDRVADLIRLSARSGNRTVGAATSPGPARPGSDRKPRSVSFILSGCPASHCSR